MSSILSTLKMVKRKGLELRNSLYDLTSKSYWQERKLAREVIDEIPSEDLEKLICKFSDQNPNRIHAINTKFLNITKWMQSAAKRAILIGLHNSNKGLHVLDLGCGTGYFLATARYLGHNIQGLDIPNNPMYNEFIELLNIPCVEHKITPHTPLPQFNTQFDIITGYMAQFNWIRDTATGKEEYWDFKAWCYFLDDCKAKLATGGRIRLELNQGHQDSFKWLPDEAANGIRNRYNATVSKNKAIIDITRL